MEGFSEDQALRVVQSFQLAALGDISWADALHDVVATFGCVSASLELIDLTSGKAQTFETLAMPEDLLQQYNERIFHLNPRVTMARRFRFGAICTDADLPPSDPGEAEFLDWLARTPARWALGGRVVEAPGSVGFIAVHFSKTHGPGTAGQSACGQLLMPHLVQTLALSRRLAEATSLVHALEHAAAGRRSAVAVLDAKGRLQHACPRFEQLLRQRVLICGHEGQLVAGDRQDQARLRQSIGLALDDGASIRAVPPIILRNEWGREEYVVRFTRIPARDETPFARSGSVVVEVSELDIATPGDASQLIAMFGLTNREAEVAVAIAGGLTVAQIALSLAISTHTVRQHLAMLFRKTGTSRQAELVALLRAVR